MDECLLSLVAKFNSCHRERFLLIRKKIILSLTFMPKTSLESMFYRQRWIALKVEFSYVPYSLSRFDCVR